MSSKLIHICNLAALGALLSSLLFALFTFFTPSPKIEIWEGAPTPAPIPHSAFAPTPEMQKAITEQLLTLRFTPPKMQLPDLAKILQYLGPNGRPDVAQESGSVYFSLSGSSGEQAAIQPGEKLYLLYDRTQSPARYIFSPKNAPTSLWVEATGGADASALAVFMLNEEGEIVREPKKRAEFTLTKREPARFNRGSNWNIGTWRVDGTLLARQKAKWYGHDKFFERHGGEEFEGFANKERIDFGDEENGYSLFLGKDEVLVWDETHWQSAKPGPETLGKPLLSLKKSGERLLTFDLWNPEGSSKLTLNLLKAQDRWIPEQLQNEFKFVSAKTRSQFIFEVGSKKMTLSPQDWLVKTENGWEKLDTIEEIDGYIDRKILGPLFVFDGVEKQDDRQVLSGTLFSKSRTEMEPVELGLPQSSVTVIKLPKAARPVMSNRAYIEK